MSIALVAILLLLGKDMRRRLSALNVTWPMPWPFARRWRIRWSRACVHAICEGRITYVNPAFCQMVGFSAEELLGQGTQMAPWPPYWPPELADEYKKRQEIRLAGNDAAARGLRVGVSCTRMARVFPCSSSKRR